MDRFDCMRALVRVAELGSFTRAATSLNLPKTTVSAQVAALERRLGVRLLDRTTRSVTPTPEGVVYLQRVSPLLSDLDEAEAVVTETAVAPRGRLRIDMPPAIGHRIVIPALPTFVRRFPDIVLDVGCTDRPVDLLSEGVDCVIRGNLIHDETLVARRLGTFDTATCASPAYLARYGVPTAPEAMAGHVLCQLFSPRDGRHFRFNVSKDGQRVDVRGRYLTAYNDIESALAGAIAGLGIVQLPLYILDEHLAAGRLVRIFEEHASDGIPVNLLYPRSRVLSLKVKVFASWVQRLFAATAHVSRTA